MQNNLIAILSIIFIVILCILGAIFGKSPIPPEPTPMPTITESPAITPISSESPEPSTSPTITPEPSDTTTPQMTPVATLTPSPTPIPTLAPTPTNTPYWPIIPGDSPTPTPTPKPTPTPIPLVIDPNKITISDLDRLSQNQYDTLKRVMIDFYIYNGYCPINQYALFVEILDREWKELGDRTLTGVSVDEIINEIINRIQ